MLLLALESHERDTGSESTEDFMVESDLLTRGKEDNALGLEMCLDEAVDSVNLHQKRHRQVSQAYRRTLCTGGETHSSM